MLEPDEQAAFLQSVAKVQEAATKHLAANRHEAAVIVFVRNLQRGVQKVVDDAVRQQVHIDCKAGCSYCCSARVEAIAPEIFLIAAELEKRSAEEREAIIARLEAHTVAATSHDASWRTRPSCPFLVDHLCSIYELRPTACRKAHSLDVRSCEASAPTIPQDLDVALKAEALIQGTAGAYREGGFDAARQELVRSVLLCLREPSTLARWFNGEKVFDTR
jgi:Fe-S-cluster containining protein